MRNGSALKEGIVQKHPETGEFIRRNDGQLTAFAAQYVENYVSNGGSSRAAFLMAGGDPERVRAGVQRLMGSAKIREAIRIKQTELMVSLANKAAGTVEELMMADDVPPNVRFQAAKWCMEAAGIGPQFVSKEPERAEDKPLDEMTIAELEAFISAGGQAVKDRREKQEKTIEHVPDPE